MKKTKTSASALLAQLQAVSVMQLFLAASLIKINQRPRTAINPEDKKMIVMLIKRVNGQIGSEFIVDVDGFAVEFKSESQIQNQIKMLKASDPTIIDFVIE
jgi:hypothetical protein